MAVDTLASALEAIAAIRRRGHHPVVIKQALGLAGGNAIRLFEPELLESHRRWIEKAVANGRQLVVEPWLERVQDFSVQLEMTADGLKLCGYTGLITDRKGQFQGNWAAPKFERRLPPGVIELFAAPPDIATRLHALYADILVLLEAELRRVGFVGPVGIDAFVYRTGAGACRLKPIVEINPRYTMGRLTVELMKHVAPGSHGVFRLVSRKQAQAEGGEDFVAYARLLTRQVPAAPRRRAGVENSRRGALPERSGAGAGGAGHLSGQPGPIEYEPCVSSGDGEPVGGAGWAAREATAFRVRGGASGPCPRSAAGLKTSRSRPKHPAP